MTVSTAEFESSYVADGLLTPRQIGFPIASPDHLVIEVDDAPQQLGQDYQVTGEYAAGGGTIVPLVAWASGAIVRYHRDTGLLQQVQLPEGQPLPSRRLERQMDHQAMRVQEVAGSLGRAVMLPRGETGVVLPRAADRAGGNKILAPHPVTGAIGVFGGSAFRGDKGDKGDPGDQDGGSLVWLDDFVEEGDLSDSEAFQRCHDYLAERIDFGETSVITVMLGSRTYHLGSAVLFDKVPMRIIGRGCSIGVEPGMGTWFTISDDSFTPFTITLGTQETRGCGFWNIGLYQIGHPPVAPGWAPKNFPHIFDVQSLLGEFTLDYIYAPNINKLVNCDLSGRLHIDNLRGMIFTNVATVDRCYDIPRIGKVHLWTYWTSLAPVLQYQQTYGDMFVFKRCDSPLVGEVFVFAANSAFKMLQSGYGITTKFIADRIICDFVRYGLYVDSPEFTCQIGALNTQHEAWPSTGAPLDDALSIYVTRANCTLQIGSLEVQRTPGPAIRVTNVGCRVDIGSALFNLINMEDEASGVVSCVDGSSVHFASPPKIIGSGDIGVTDTGGALVSTGLVQNHPVGGVNSVFAAGGAAGIGPKLYADGPATNVPLQLTAKGNEAVQFQSPIKPKLMSAAALPLVGRLGEIFAVDDAISVENGAIVQPGGTGQALVCWVRDGWRVVVGGTAFTGGELPERPVVRIFGEDDDGPVQQTADEMVLAASPVVDLRERDSVVQLREAGAPLDGTSDDRAGIAAAYAAASRGLSLDLAAPLRMKLATPLTIEGKPFVLNGGGASYSLDEATAIEIACADAFDIRNSDGFSVRNAHIRATGAALTSGSVFDFKASEVSSSNSGMLLFDNLRIESPWQAFTFRKTFQAQLRGVRIANARGAYAIGVNGLNDDAQGNIFEFLGGGTGALKGSQTDHVVFDGGSGSAKFAGWAMNFGRHAIVSKSDTVGSPIAILSVTQAPDGSFRITTDGNHGLPNGSVVEIAAVSPAGIIDGQQTINYISPTVFDLDGTEWIADTYTGGTVQNVQGRDPGFIFSVASGVENITGDAFHLERGGLVVVGDGYYSTDRGGSIVKQFSTYKGRLKFSNCMMRAAGRHGVALLAGNTTLADCDIVNAGGSYVDTTILTIASIADNGDNLIRVTTAAAHGLTTGDQIRQTRCGSANGTFIVTVISSTVYDCQGSSFASGAVAGAALRLQQVVTAIADNGTGGIRITVPNGAFDDGEWVRLSGFGSNANSDFRVAKEDATHYLLVMGTGGVAPAYVGGYAATGLIQRCSAQLYIGPNAKNISVNGGLIGTDAQGLNRARYAIIIEPGCKNVTIDCDISIDARSGILNLSASEPTVQIRNRRLSEANLRAIRALVTAADKMSYWTGGGTAALTDLTAQGRTLLAGVDAAAQRTALALGTAATVNTGTSGSVLGLLNANLTFSGSNTFNGGSAFTSATFASTIVRGGTSAITFNLPDGNSISSPAIQTQSTTQTGALMSSVLTTTSGTSSPAFSLAKRRDTANAALTSGSRLGDFGWSGSDGTNIIGAAAIRCEATADFTANAANTRIMMLAATAGAPTEVARFDPTNGLSMFGANPAIDANRLFRTRPYTVGTLPTVGTADRLCSVTDANAPTWNATLAGGGAVRCLAYDNGTNWTAH